MHRFVFILVVFFSTLTSAKAASWADILFQERVKDFGSVPRGPTLQYAFPLTNNSDRTIRISELRVSCGCVTATADSKELEPGERTMIRASMDTTRFEGIKSVTIYVKFSRPRREEVRLWVRANSRNDVTLSPATLAFGQVQRGTTPVLKTTITFHGDGNARVLEAKCESNYVKPSFREISRTASEAKYELIAEVRPDAPVGKWYTDIWVTTSSSSMPRLRIPTTVEVESVLSVTPGIVDMGQVRRGSTVERKVILRGVTPFKVIGVRGAPEFVTIRDATRTSKPIHVLTIRLEGRQPGNLKQLLSLVTDLKGDSEVQVTMTANVLP